MSGGFENSKQEKKVKIRNYVKDVNVKRGEETGMGKIWEISQNKKHDIEEEQ